MYQFVEVFQLREKPPDLSGPVQRTRIAELHALKDESNAIGEEMRSVKKREKLKAVFFTGTNRMSIYNPLEV